MSKLIVIDFDELDFLKLCDIPFLDIKSTPSVNDKQYKILKFEHRITRSKNPEKIRKYDPIENFKYSFPEIFNEGTFNS